MRQKRACALVHTDAETCPVRRSSGCWRAWGQQAAGRPGDRGGEGPQWTQARSTAPRPPAQGISEIRWGLGQPLEIMDYIAERTEAISQCAGAGCTSGFLKFIFMCAVCVMCVRAHACPYTGWAVKSRKAWRRGDMRVGVCVRLKRSGSPVPPDPRPLGPRSSHRLRHLMGSGSPGHPGPLQ